jgi:ABC-type multidrug transport system permease subunit
MMTLTTCGAMMTENNFKTFKIVAVVAIIAAIIIAIFVNLNREVAEEIIAPAPASTSETL